MEDIRIAIVDDSPFTVEYIRNILESNGYEVVGTAGTLEETKRVVKETNPTLVTMDMTLPGTDGFACTRAIHEINKDIKIIVISSMMDDEIVSKAKKYNVSAYIQKPFDADELITIIKRLMAREELYRYLQREYFAVFKEVLLDGLNRMTKNLLIYKEEYDTSRDCESAGLSIIIGIIGSFSGRMLLDLSRETANNIAAAVYRRDLKDHDELIAAIGEFANIIAGNACSIMNRKNKALGLRVAPPSILTGDNVLILAPDFSTKTAIGESSLGQVMLNVGFTRGAADWMLSL
jgi:CheY-like chemotaxis protein/CheY-specific phosphatase CheX